MEFEELKTRFLSDAAEFATGALRALYEYPRLVAIGTAFYLGVFCALIYGITAQIHLVGPRPASVVRTEPTALTLPVLVLATEECFASVDSGRRYCDAQARLDTPQLHAKRLLTNQQRWRRGSPGNLLWAPPGTVLAAAREAPAVIARADYFSADASQPAGAFITTLASR